MIHWLTLALGSSQFLTVIMLKIDWTPKPALTNVSCAKKLQVRLKFLFCSITITISTRE